MVRIQTRRSAPCVRTTLGAVQPSTGAPSVRRAGSRSVVSATARKLCCLEMAAPAPRTVGLVANSLGSSHPGVVTEGTGRRQASPSCGVGSFRVNGFPSTHAKAMAMSMREGVPPPSSLSLLRLQSEVDRIWRETDGGLPKLVPLENGDLVHEVHQFSERANWLVPGKVLLGKYPGQIPADLPTEPQRQLARDRILEIVLRGGVTDLFCLQAELPPQDDQSRWHPPADDKDNGSFFEGFRAYRGDAVAAVAAASAAATAAPASTVAAKPPVDGSAAGGGDGDLGGAQKYVGGLRGAEGLAFHHFPIPDLSPAENTEFLAGLVDELESLVASGKVPFIHCWAGRGRTGLIASCLLGRLYPELSAEQSLSRVDAYYRTRGTVAIGKTCRVSPETPEQEDQVRLFFKEVLKR